MFEVQNGVRVDVTRRTDQVNQRSFPLSHSLKVSQAPSDYKSALDEKSHTPEATMSRLPAWVAYDRKVLRFFGYFQEDVAAGSQEKYRIRKCVVYFYLEDDSVHIAEPKVENSGIPQGVLIKRHRIPKSNNQYISMDDLYVGSKLAIYGRTYNLVDCDTFTRQLYSARGTELGTPLSCPDDPYTVKTSIAASHLHNKLMNPLKEFMEASLGKPMNQEIEATQKFLNNDGKVLRFYCTWSDNTMYGERRPYILHYFLADDTVEVLNIQQPNSGRDPFPSLLKRSKLPKNYADTASDISRIGQRDTKNVAFYSETDFRIGGKVNVFGRELFICGCDRFTQEYYMNNFGMVEADFPQLQLDPNEKPLAKMPAPAYNGFGTEEDSLGSFLYLMPKIPKQDFKKLMQNDGKNMRFLGKFLSPKAEDANRQFIITFYLNNDTLSVFEKFERNSGFIGGKFLERTRLKNPDTATYYKAADFAVGQILTINQYKYKLVEADEYTKKFMDNNPQLFGTASLDDPLQ